MSPPILRVVAALDSPELEGKLDRLADVWRQLLEVDTTPERHAVILECRDELNKPANCWRRPSNCTIFQ